MKKIVYLSLFIVASLPFKKSKAQYSFNGTVNTTVTIPTVMSVQLIQNSSSTVNFSSATQYSNGLALNNFYTAEVQSNIPWVFSVAASTPFFSASGAEASTNMPCSVLAVKLSTQANFTNLATTNVTLASGTNGSKTVAGNTFNLDIKANPGYNYGAGIYSLVVNYTLTAQ